MGSAIRGVARINQNQEAGFRRISDPDIAGEQDSGASQIRV